MFRCFSSYLNPPQLLVPTLQLTALLRRESSPLYIPIDPLIPDSATLIQTNRYRPIGSLSHSLLTTGITQPSSILVNRLQNILTMAVPPEMKRYDVFISSAGEDKETIAIPLQQKLTAMGITSYLDPPHTRTDKVAPTALTIAMETTPIAVVILSPELVARRWPMRELLCFIRRHIDSEEGRTTPFTLYTFYYRLRTSELFDEPRLDRPDIRGNQLYRESKFYERMTQGEPEASIAGVKMAMRDIRRAPGMDNENRCNNKDTEEMKQKREEMITALAEKVSKITPGDTAPKNQNFFNSY